MERRVSSATFSIPAPLLGDPRRFDFYAFIEDDGALDEAQSHVLFTAASLPWTYPKQAVGAAYPAETYQDGSDITLHERPEIVIPIIGGMLLAGAALVAALVWGGRRRRRRSGVWAERSGAYAANLPAAMARECRTAAGR